MQCIREGFQFDQCLQNELKSYRIRSADLRVVMRALMRVVIGLKLSHSTWLQCTELKFVLIGFGGSGLGCLNFGETALS